MNHYLFFDTASTTKCCEAALRALQQYSSEDFGNPSSSHAFGQKAARALRDARYFFSDYFRVEPEQVIFTGSGTEANNLALFGMTSSALARDSTKKFQITISSIEHPSVRSPALALKDFGVECEYLPCIQDGQIQEEILHEKLRPSTLLLSIQQVNNILGTHIDVEAIARKAKEIAPSLFIHSDCIQSFGKVNVPRSPSSVDLVSISGHKIEGPKGVGALIILNKQILAQNLLRPLVWGGGQEGGFRSGTQSVGCIAGFHAAAKHQLRNLDSSWNTVLHLRKTFREQLISRGLLIPDSRQSPVIWNSPESAIPFIISLSVPGYSASALTRLLEDRGCLVSVGSACSAGKLEQDPVLTSFGFSSESQKSAFRVSLSPSLQEGHLSTLVQALEDSINRMKILAGKTGRERKKSV